MFRGQGGLSYRGLQKREKETQKEAPGGLNLSRITRRRTTRITGLGLVEHGDVRPVERCRWRSTAGRGGPGGRRYLEGRSRRGSDRGAREGRRRAARGRGGPRGQAPPDHGERPSQG